jgi:lysozyme family protein
VTPREAVARSIVAFEGGDANDPDDRGGWTRFGLTVREFQRLRPGKTEADFRALTRDDVVDIITEEYALRPGYWRIADQWVMWAVVDFAINSGVGTATKALQRAAGLSGDAVDGIVGRETEMAVSRMGPERLFRRLMAQRVRFFAGIIRRDHSQAKFAGGWFARAAAILEEPA